MVDGVSIIVTTYNWPRALDSVLAALSVQDYPHIEVIVADDGSTDETAAVIHRWQQHFPFRLIHCWQQDEGFRAAMSRNRAVAQSKYNYLLFIDGDCIVFKHFVSRHVKLAQKGWYVAGNRVLLSKSFTESVLSTMQPIHTWSLWKWHLAYWRGDTNGVSSLYPIPLGWLRKINQTKWIGAKTCNLGVWRDDFMQVNGFDESFEGWGSEDSDCIIRLQKINTFRKSSRFSAPVLHLWHPQADRAQAQSNESRLQETLQSSSYRALQGVEQYLV